MVTVTTGGARGDAKPCAEAGAGEAAERMDDSGGGAGVINPLRLTDSAR